MTKEKRLIFRKHLTTKGYQQKKGRLSYRHVLTLFAILFFYFSANAQNYDTQNTEDSIGNQSLALSREDSIAAKLKEWNESIRIRLNEISARLNDTYFNTGFYVYDLTADTMVYGYNERRLMRPASTMKVITAVAALDLLGASHRYDTKVFYSGEISDSILYGDIYVKGDFDPAFNETDLNAVANEIKSMGITAIHGQILGDVSMKDSTVWGEGWCWDDAPSDVEPYLTPLLLNRGCVTVRMSGGRASLSPSTSYLKIRNTGGGGFYATRNWISNGNIISTGGSSGSKTISVYHPEKFFVCTLADKLMDRGVRIVTDSINPLPVYDIKPIGQTMVTEICHCPRTVEQILQRMMKESDNLYAESMFYKMANQRNGKWATSKNGQDAVESVMSKAGINVSYCRVADGSGVSLYNYVSPRQMVQMLKYAYDNNSIFRHLYPALPIAGVDGTLANRMQEGKTNRNVHAKTGTVRGVSGLAGYVTASNGHLLAFSILSNGVLKASSAKTFQNAICQELAK